MAKQKTKTTVKHDFTTEEWKEKTDVLTRRMRDCDLKEESIKASAASAKSELKQMKADVNDLANDLRNGYSMQEVDATVEMHRKKGVKKFYHFAPGKPHNGSFIREEAMTEDDYQTLPLPGDGDPSDASAEPAKDLDAPPAEEKPSEQAAGTSAETIAEA